MEKLHAPAYRDAAGEAVQHFIEGLPAEGPIAVGLCGGGSIPDILDALVSALSELEETARSRLNFFLVDERMVPPASPESNMKLLNDLMFERLLAAAKLSTAQIFAVDTLLPAENAARDYERRFFELTDRFHAAFLGAGPDGHTASLFPGHHTIRNLHDGFFAVFDSPKPPAVRVTASRALLQRTGQAFLLFKGESKKMALQRLGDKSLSVEDCPAKIGLEALKSFLVTDITE